MSKDKLISCCLNSPRHLQFSLTPSEPASGSIKFCFSLTEEGQREEARRGGVFKAVKEDGEKADGVHGCECWKCINTFSEFGFLFLKLLLMLPPAELHGEGPNRQKGGWVFQTKDAFLQTSLDPSI